MQSLDENPWLGIYIYSENNQMKSSIRNLVVENFANTKKGILDLTGGFNIYNQNVDIKNLILASSNAEDALNLVKSRVNIDNVSIKMAKSDGIDCDFCEGELKNLSFYNIGGDGLDISGSKILASISYANNVKDKVLSIGEKSNAEVFLDKVDNSYIGAAIKDASEAYIEINELNTVGPNIITFIKKDIYQGKTKAYISRKNNVNFEKYLAGKDTDLYINRNKIEEDYIDVDYLYKNGKLKK